MQAWFLPIYTFITVLLWWLQSELFIRSIILKVWLAYLLFKVLTYTEETFALFAHLKSYPRMVKSIKKIASLILISWIAYFAINDLPHLIAHQSAYKHAKQSNAIAWLHDETYALDKANDLQQSLIIDFYADWCFPCKQMEINTFSDVELQNILAQSYVALKIDASKPSNKTQALLNKYRINSFPSIVIIPSHQRSPVRLIGYTDAYQLKQALNRHK